MPSNPARLPPLDLLAAFESAARHRSFTLAANERFVTQSAISRQIKALEDDLGVTLFHRRHRTLELTDEGRFFHEAVTGALAEIRRAATRLRTPVTHAVLTVTTTPGFASLWLIPRLAEFTRAHPKVNVRLDASYTAREVGLDGIDVAIRYGRVGTTPGRRLSGEEVMPVCSPALVDPKSRRLRRPLDLAQFPLLAMAGGPLASQRSPLVDWDAWFEANGVHGPVDATTIAFSDYDDVVRAALLGQGIALGRRPLVDALVESGQLVIPLAGAMTSPRAYFVVVSPESAHREATDAFVAWLFAAMAKAGVTPAPAA